MTETIVCASGYFNPLHFGHIEYLEKSKSLGDKLIVIVNSDRQSYLKKGSSFMSEDERLKIIRSGTRRSLEEKLKQPDAIISF